MCRALKTMHQFKRTVKIGVKRLYGVKDPDARPSQSIVLTCMRWVEKGSAKE